MAVTGIEPCDLALMRRKAHVASTGLHWPTVASTGLQWPQIGGLSQTKCPTLAPAGRGWPMFAQLKRGEKIGCPIIPLTCYLPP